MTHTYTVRELIESLEGFDPDAEIRLAMQPAWPFEYNIGEISEVEVGGEDPDEWDMDDPGEKAEYERRAALPENKPTKVVYLAEGAQLAYLPGAAVRALGWSRR